MSIGGWIDVTGPAKGYPYQVREDGAVRRKGGDRLTPYPRGGADGRTYLAVDLRAPDRPRLQVYVHQLVAHAFVPPREPGLEVDHIDGDERNNHADNLMWTEPEAHAGPGS